MVDNDLPVWGWAIVLLIGLFIKVYASYDFAVRVPGNGARRAAILQIMETLLRNADSVSYSMMFIPHCVCAITLRAGCAHTW